MTLPIRTTGLPESALLRWDARWKLATLILAGIAVALLKSPVPAGSAALLALGLAAIGRVPIAVMVSRLGILALGITPVVLIVPFTNANGLTLATTLAFRTIALGTLAVVLVRTTPLNQTFTAANRLFVPGVLVQIAQLAYRYSLLFFAEARRLRIALRTRGFRPFTNTQTYRTLGSSAGTLLVRGGEHAERVADAMRTRGFDGRFRTLTAFQTRTADVAATLCVLAAFFCLVIWDRLA
jgi:cobalt/nickel transport system permease protein